MMAGRKANVRSGVVTIGIMLASVFMLKAAEESPFGRVDMTNARDLYGLCAVAMTGPEVGEIDSDVIQTAATLGCAGYLTGAIDGMRLAFGAQNVEAFCPPDKGINGKLAMAMYVKYYLKHKDEAKVIDTSRAIVLLMLIEEYPCPKAAKP